MDPSQILQMLFLLAAVTILLVDNLPALRMRYIPYGPRAAPLNDCNQNKKHTEDAKASQSTATGVVGSPNRWLDALATLQVPHGFFIHFYIASVLSSGFWAIQMMTRGFAFRAICRYVESMDRATSMSYDQIVLTWALMTVQGIRRLVESTVCGKASVSTMWFAHWLLGVTFYIAFGIALWIEGAPTLLFADSVYSSITMSAPSLKTIIGVPIFILASGIQHDCHAYLASLPEYSLPMHPIFQVLICPHYFTECLIYLSLAIIGAPRDAVCNKTIFSALVFVAINLAVTASTTKEWYERRFGKEAVAGKWKMVPWLF